MKNSQQHLGNEANLATFSLSQDVIFLMVSPLLQRFLVSFNLQSAICGLWSAGYSLQSAVCKCHTPLVLTKFVDINTIQLLDEFFCGICNINNKGQSKCYQPSLL